MTPSPRFIPVAIPVAIRALPLLALAVTPAAGCGTVLESWQEVAFLDDGDLTQDFSGDYDCHGGELDSYVAHDIGYPELHIIGTYGTSLTPDGLPGEVAIYMERPLLSTLVLSSYEPTRWTVHLADHAQVERIIVNGYYASEVVIEPPNEDIFVTRISHEEDGTMLGLGHSWPSESERNGVCEDFYDAEACELLDDGWRYELQRRIERLEDLVDNAQVLSGRALTSFHGCYSMTEFTLTDPILSP